MDVDRGVSAAKDRRPAPDDVIRHGKRRRFDVIVWLASSSAMDGQPSPDRRSGFHSKAATTARGAATARNCSSSARAPTCTLRRSRLRRIWIVASAPSLVPRLFGNSTHSLGDSAVRFGCGPDGLKSIFACGSDLTGGCRASVGLRRASINRFQLATRESESAARVLGRVPVTRQVAVPRRLFLRQTPLANFPLKLPRPTRPLSDTSRACGN